MEQGFDKSQRLLVPREYSEVFNSPQYRVSGRHLLLLARPTDASIARLGLVISRKNVGNAVKRNRIKRLSRESFRKHKVNGQALDIVLLARPGISKLGNRAIIEMLDKALQQLLDQSTGENPSPAADLPPSGKSRPAND